MIWLALALLAAVALAPLAFSLRRMARGQARARGRREAALALHRAQLDELDRDRAEGRIGETEHATAKLEVERRLLAAAAEPDIEPRTGSGQALIAALVLVPIAAFGLYRISGQPYLPAAPLAERIAAARERVAAEDTLIAQLRAKIAELDPKSDRAREGYVLLGGAEANRGNMAAAAAAWRAALAVHFDATLAAETAEAIRESEGRLTDESVALFRRALAEAPADAPWRPMAERRLKEAAN